jgi:hypothetical protein
MPDNIETNEGMPFNQDRRDFLKKALYGLGGLAVAGCTPIVKAETIAPPTNTSEPTNTTKATATNTAEPTATATTEPTKTSTPTETAVPKENVLTMNPENPTFVPWEEAKVGNMNDAFEVEFSDDASWESDLALSFNQTFNASYLTRLTMTGLSSVDNRPVKITGYGKTTTDDGMELIIVREAIKNADGTVGHWNFVFDAEKFKKFWWSYGNDLKNGNEFLMPIIGTGQTKVDISDTPKKLRLLTNQSYSNALQDYKEFIETQTVPKEMELHLLIGKPERWC